MNCGEILADMEAIHDLIQTCSIENFNEIRRLVQKYRPNDLDRLIHFATTSPRDSIHSSSGYSLDSVFSTISRNAGTASSLSFNTDPGSIGPGRPPGGTFPAQAASRQFSSNLSGTSTPIDQYPAESPLPATSQVSLDAHKDVEQEQTGDATDSKFRCPFCSEYSTDKTPTFGRKSELKRHLLNYHATSKQWSCKLGSCGLSFDFRSAYDAHVKQDHDGVKDPDAKVNLCQQVVFACGFKECRKVFEASCDEEGPAVRSAYFDHVLDHVVKPGDDTWDYSRRIRNLLHQKAVEAYWKGRYQFIDQLVWDQDLSWRPQCSSMLRAMLECRHLVHPVNLCKFAVQLGSKRPTQAPAVPPVGFTTPLLNTCSSRDHQPHQDPRFSQSGRNLQHEVTQPRTERRAARGGASRLRNSPSVPAMSSSFNPQTEGNSSDIPWPEMLPQTGSALESFSPSTFLANPMVQANPAMDLSGGGVAATTTPQFHPMHAFNGSGAFGVLPQQEEVIAGPNENIFYQHVGPRSSKSSGKLNHVFTKLRARRASSPESDTHMSESPPQPQPPMPTVPMQGQNSTVTLRPSSSSMSSMNTSFFPYPQ